MAGGSNPAAAIPERKACMDTSHHQGASDSLVAFQSLFSEKGDHDNEAVRWFSAIPASRSADLVLRFVLT